MLSLLQTNPILCLERSLGKRYAPKRPGIPFFFILKDKTIKVKMNTPVSSMS